MRTFLTAFALAALMCGCSESGLRLVPAQGKVQFAGGTIPSGEVMVIRFEPTAGGDEQPAGPQVAGKSPAQQQRKAAAGNIKPDGTFVLSTNEPEDGAYEGRYKVTLSMWKTYLGHEPLISSKYERPETTPLEATVKAGEANDFRFELQAL